MNTLDCNFFNKIPCNIFSFTNEGIIDYTNDTLSQLLQYNVEELKGESIIKILTLSSRIFYQTHFFPLLTLQGEVKEIFLTLQCRDRTVIPVLLNATQHKQDNVAINICACITVNKRNKYENEILEAKRLAEDSLQKNELLQTTQLELEIGKQQLDRQVTHLKQTNEELLQLNEVVTHDLQEPLRKINLYADLVVNDKDIQHNPKIVESLSIIIKSVKRIRSLLRVLQGYLPILSDTVKKTQVDLNTLVLAALQDIREKNPGVALDATVEKLPVIVADPVQLKILFDELVRNSVEFRSKVRNLHIKIATSMIEENLYNSTEGKYKYAEFVQITFEDNGIGFKPGYSELIFKLLKKLDLKKNGLGMGLAFCKRVVENHGGVIRAYGEEGKGAKFIMSLPLD